MRSHSFVVTLACLAAGVVAALASTTLLTITGEMRPAGPQAIGSTGAASPMVPLSLRLVDAGGVGIRPDTAIWGQDYSHNTRAFHHIILRGPPHVDSAAFEAVRAEWRRHIRRMRRYGNNGLVVDGFLEFVQFSNVEDGYAVYGPHEAMRARHRVLRSRFNELFAEAAQSDMYVFLRTDFLPLTAHLEQYLAATPGGLDPANAHMWDVYAAGLEELFASMPDLSGVVVRIGEAGLLFNRSGWDYRSELAVRDSTDLHAMLAHLLPVFERWDRTLILRTWTVGVGPLGELHNESETYQRVLDGIDSPNLILSTKYVAGDFFTHLPLNPTLTGGRHRRLIEFQARREFEGFGAFPNYMAADHQEALLALGRENPNVIGTLLWAQSGGPLRAGPMSLYPLHGFWTWTDANVYATSALARDPFADVQVLAARWARQEFGEDTVLAAAMERILMRSRDAVKLALYIRPYAAHRVSLGDLELPPMLWIHEWDVVGGWNAVLSTVYRFSRGDIRRAVDDGFRAVDLVQEMQRRLEGVASRFSDTAHYERMAASLAYEESLFTALAWYRRTFLQHYRWLDTGSEEARRDWQVSRAAFAAARDDHLANWEDQSLNFPAYRFDAADAGLEQMRRGAVVAWIARGTGAFVLLLLVVRTLSTPEKLNGAGKRLSHHTAAPGIVTASGLAIVGAVIVGCATAFMWEALVLGVFAAILLGTIVLKVIWLSVTPTSRDVSVPLVLFPCVVAALPVLGVIGFRGPLVLWYVVWSGTAARMLLIGATAALIAWALVTAFKTARMVSGGVARAAGGLLAACGVVGLGVLLALPGVEGTLTKLDLPLGILPMRLSILLGLIEHMSLPRGTPWYVAAVGAGFVLLGVALARSQPRRG